MKNLTIMAVFSLCMLFSHSSNAVERYALVIGNGNYDVGPLKNPHNDANDMAAELTNLGYKLHGGKAWLDLDLATFENELREFAFSLPREAVALVYYAGHGAATREDNFLIPVGSTLAYEEQLKTRTVSLRDTVALLNSRNRDGLNVFLLDACRDNPLQQQFRSASRGLRRIGDLARGSFIGYAADRSQVAADGDGRNGLYTSALLNALRTNPSQPIQLLHNQVAKKVFEQTRSTGNPQLPVSEQKFIGEYCIGSCATEKKETGKLTVKVSPPNANVVLMNWEKAYTPGIELPKNQEYDVLVTLEGYSRARKKITLTENRQVVGVELEKLVPKRNLVEPATPNTPATPAGNQQTSSSTKWMYGILGILVVGALIGASSGGGGGDSGSDPTTFRLDLPQLP